MNLAPVILYDGWRRDYAGLINRAAETLRPELKERLFFEIIFMTYGLATEALNREAFPGLTGFHRPDLMWPKGRGKTC